MATKKEETLPEGLKAGHTDLAGAAKATTDIEPNFFALGKEQARLVHKREIELSPELCQTYYEMAQLSDERGLRQHKLIPMRDAMLNGVFPWGQIKLAYITVDGRKIRMDGQKTVTAYTMALQWMTDHPEKVKEDNITLPTPIVTESAYAGDNLGQARELYTSIDVGQVRVVVHNFKVLFTDSPLAKLMSSRTGDRFRAAMVLHLTGQSRATGDRPSFAARDILEQLHSIEYFATIKKINALLDAHTEGKPRDKFLKAAVLAAMITTYKAAPKLAAQFWPMVLDGLNVTKTNDPRKRMHDVIVSDRRGSSTDAKSVKSADKAILLYRQLLTGFNCFVNEESMERLPSLKTLTTNPEILTKPEAKPAKRSRSKKK